MLSVFVSQKSIFSHYCIQNVKDGIQARVSKIRKESVSHFCQLISVKVKKILRKSQAQFEKIEAQAKLWFSYEKERLFSEKYLRKRGFLRPASSNYFVVFFIMFCSLLYNI